VAGGYSAWAVEATDLPAGAQSFFVAGGHAIALVGPPGAPPMGTRYWVLSRDATAGNPLVLYRHNDGPGWTSVFSGVLGANPGLIHAWYGPVYPNPYDTREAWWIAGDGIHVTRDAGKTVPVDDVLTALLTGSGQYPLTNDYLANGAFDGTIGVPASTRALALSTLSQMAFARDNPKIHVAASPFTGVFYDGGDGIWRDLGPTLPHPLSAVAGVRSDATSVYVAFEGRSIVRIDKPGDAPAASYFTRGGSGNTLAVLDSATRNPIAGAQVSLRIIDPTAQAELDYGGTTSSGGEVASPLSIPIPSGSAVFIRFAGSGSQGPADIRFVMP
jgi:hypothetical protein